LEGIERLSHPFRCTTRSREPGLQTVSVPSDGFERVADIHNAFDVAAGVRRTRSAARQTQGALNKEEFAGFSMPPPVKREKAQTLRLRRPP
jgi:hypothetical protein